MDPNVLDRLRDAAAALDVAARAHPDELDVRELRGRLADVADSLEALDVELGDDPAERAA